MADEETTEVEETEEQPEEKKGLSSTIKIILIVIVLALLSTGAFFVSKTFLLPKYEAYKEAKLIEEQERIKNQVPVMGLIHVINNITVNTLGSGGRRYVIAEVALEVADQTIVDEIIMREPQIRDVFIRYLRRQTAQHVLDLGFQERSRRDLTDELNAHLNTGQVDSLYYIKLLLQ